MLLFPSARPISHHYKCYGIISCALIWMFIHVVLKLCSELLFSNLRGTSLCWSFTWCVALGNVLYGPHQLFDVSKCLCLKNLCKFAPCLLKFYTFFLGQRVVFEGMDPFVARTPFYVIIRASQWNDISLTIRYDSLNNTLLYYTAVSRLTHPSNTFLLHGL